MWAAASNDPAWRSISSRRFQILIERLPRALHYVLGQFVRMIERDLLVGAIQPIVFGKQFEPVRLSTSPNCANKGLARAIPLDLSLGIPGSLVSAMLVLEQFAVHAN